MTRVLVILPRSVLKEVNRGAARQARTRSDFVRTALRLYIRTHHPELSETMGITAYEHASIAF